MHYGVVLDAMQRQNSLAGRRTRRAPGTPNHAMVIQPLAPSRGQCRLGRDFIFIGNSGWDAVDDQNVFAPAAAAQGPVLLRLRP